jgi:hypothetical protein
VQQWRGMQWWPIPVPIPCPAPVPAVFPEWLKILITALASLSVGLLLEPIRSMIQHRFAMHRTHSIVADEIDALALTMRIFLPVRRETHSPKNPVTQKPSLNIERYNYAYEKNRDHLYHIPGWDSLKRFYDAIKLVNAAEMLTDEEVFRLTMEFALLAERIQEGILGQTMRRKLIQSKFSHLPVVANDVLTHPINHKN